MCRNVLRPQPFPFVLNNWNRCVKPYWTTRLLHVMRLQSQAGLHSNNIGGSKRGTVFICTCLALDSRAGVRYTCIIKFRDQLSFFVVPTPQTYISAQTLLRAAVIFASTRLQGRYSTINVYITSKTVLRHIEEICRLVFGIISIHALNRIRFFAARDVAAKVNR